MKDPVKIRYFHNAVEKLLCNMPKDLNEIEKARYIYLNLGLLFCYDERYFFGNSKMQNKIYHSIRNKKIDYKEIKEKTKKRVVCISMADFFKTVLSNVGIEAKNYQPDLLDSHTITQMFISDENGNKHLYLADLNNDLKFIQLKLPTRNFCSFGENIITPVDLKEIDQKLDYNYTGVSEIQNSIEKVKSAFSKSSTLGEKLKTALEYASSVSGVKDLAFVESTSFYKYFLRHSFDKKDLNSIKNNIIYQKSDNGFRKNFLSLYTAVETKNNFDGKNVSNYTYFIYSNVDKKFNEISKDDLINFISQKNFSIYNSESIPGIRDFEISR